MGNSRSRRNLAIQEYIGLFSDIREANYHLTGKLHIQIRKDTVQIGTVALEDVFIYNKGAQSPPEDPIVQEANGLILNEKGEIVSMGFKNFYNIHKPYAAKIRWDSAKAQLMDDGTLAVIYYYKGDWNIQTKHRANADQPMRGSSITIRMAVTEVLRVVYGGRPFMPFDNFPNRDMCYVFEYVSPYNTGVTPYHDSNLVLLGVVNKLDLREMSDSWVDTWMVNYGKGYKFMRPREYRVERAEEAMDLIPFVPTLRKGLVVKDWYDNRVFVPNPEYAFIKRLIANAGDFNTHFLASIALSEDGNRVAYHFPQLVSVIRMYHETLYELSRIAANSWSTSRLITNKRSFSEAIFSQPPIVKAVLYMMRRNQIENLEAGFKRIRPKTLTKAVKWRYGNKFTDELEILESGGAQIGKQDQVVSRQIDE